jgi:transposase InsO family protein
MLRAVSLVTGPNQLWCMDFKGYFATGDGKRAAIGL